MNHLTAISVLFVGILSAFAKKVNLRALDVDDWRELKSSGSKSGKGRQNFDVNGTHVLNGDCELKGKSSKGSKSRRALELHSESELKFEDVEIEDLKFEVLLP